MRCVLTYEFENVDADGLDAVIKGWTAPQGTDLLQLKSDWKGLSRKQGPSHRGTLQGRDSSQDLANIDLSKNYVLKTATGGWHGHGQKVIRSEEDLEAAYTLADLADCVLEEFVNFDPEISVIVSEMARTYGFPVQENIHRNNILSKPLSQPRI